LNGGKLRTRSIVLKPLLNILYFLYFLLLYHHLYFTSFFIIIIISILSTYRPIVEYRFLSGIVPINTCNK
jgi:hypothetical protein